ncbi:MAG TPA: hypothetical protein DCQ93_08535 [Bacteroidetes bacterium]|nr:hypothetical protein [Bacteroidota bacterium]
MNQQLLKQAEELRARAARVSEKYFSLSEHNTRLKTEVDSLKEKLRMKDTELEKLEELLKVKNLGEAVSFSKSGDNAELKKKLNQYIKEVDKCIHLIKAM